MDKPAMCRICLAEEVRMYVVVNKDLQALYEKLTDVPFVTEDRRPMLACFFCYTKLKQCEQFKKECLEAEELFDQMLNKGCDFEYSKNSIKNHTRLRFYGGFSETVMEHTSIYNNECILHHDAIKEEPPDVCERQDDIIEPEEEHQSEELGQNNVHSSSTDVDDISSQHSETDSEDDVPMMEFKIEEDEEQDVPTKKRSRETERIPIVKILKLDLRKTLDDIIAANRKKNELSNSEIVRNAQYGGPIAKRPKLDLQGSKSQDTIADTQKKNEQLDSRINRNTQYENNNTIAETDVADSVTPTSKQCAPIAVNDNECDVAIDERIRLTDDLSDCDTDIEDEDVHPLTSRNASAEPALHTDLTSYEARVLSIEDQRNDLAMREFVPHDCYDFNWTSDRKTFTGRRENFTGTSGPTFPMTDQTRIVDIFYKMIDNDFIDRICTETNRYADQKIKLLKDQNKYFPTSRFYTWTPTDRDEMISFLAIIILQGLYPLPEEESYFGFNGFGTMPYFSKTLSYNRFVLIKSMMHFVDNETIHEPNKLCKIQPVTDYFNDKFSSIYKPSQEIVIVESHPKWPRRLGFAQKVPSKASRQVRVKTYELCESSSGYLWKFFIYAGKDKTRTATATTTTTDDVNDDEITDEEPTDQPTTGSSDVRPTNATAKIVYDLVKPLLHRGHTLVMDNFHNSPLLARCLKRQQTDCYGALRLNRKFAPDSLKTLPKTDLRHGEVMASYCTDLSVIVWRGSNLVSMISTYHALQIGAKQKNNRLTCSTPSVVVDYNKSMGGVNRKEQFLSTQPMEGVKNRIWYKQVFRRLFNCAIFNCYTIFKAGNNNISHRQFRITLAEDLIKIHRHIDLTTEPHLTHCRTGATAKSYLVGPKTAHRPKLEHRHFPVKNGFRQGRCWMCTQAKISTRTVWKCLQCNVNLCINKCFMAYHT